MTSAGLAPWIGVWFAALSLGGGPVAGSPPAGPPPPPKYDVTVRYRIDGGRTQRLADYFAMARYFESLGFVPDPNQDIDPADPYETRLRGTISSAHVRRLFDDPHVKALLLVPAGYQLPADPAAPVKVQLELMDGLPPQRQALFAAQVRDKLAQLGFREAVGYDNRGHTRVVGSIPSAEVETLLKDLRAQPAGWLAPAVPVRDLPTPLREVSPVRVVAVLPEPPGVAPARTPEQPPGPPDERDPLQKLSPEVRALAAQEQAGKPERLEVILAFTPAPEDESWHRALTGAAPSILIEGRLGPVVTVLAGPRQAAALAAVPVVSVVRLPRPALVSLIPPWKGPEENSEALRLSGLDRLHALGFRGRGIRVAVVDGNFRGYERLKGPLGDRLHYVDWTAGRNPSLEPDPFPGESGMVGAGTQAALALTLAAPAADLTLIRIDPAAPHQLDEVIRWLDGEAFVSHSMDQRRLELDADADRFRRRRADLIEERQALLGQFGQDEETVKRRAEHARKAAQLARDEEALLGRQRRYQDLLAAQQALKGIRVVACGLVWSSGYPVDGASPLTRRFGNAPLRHTLWFQAAGNTRGQAWAGLFRDADGNGVMEFAPPGTPLPPERWTAELNFLAWQPVGKARTPDLPAKARLRLSVQWREPHDPEVVRLGPDAYLRPLADLALVVVRQRDATGTRLPADDLEVVARSAGLARRLDNEPGSATYEQTVEFTVDPAGRYAVRVEGGKPERTQPPGVPVLPVGERSWDLWPRLFVEVLDPASRLAGRAVFLDYATDLGTLGVPADARGLVTVGAADRDGRPRPYSTSGPPLNRDLLVKPDVLAFEGFRLNLGGSVEIYGSDLATPFATGLSASVLSARTPLERWARLLCSQPRQLLQVP